ncbi:MAG TPA: MFS transporter [Rhodanobacteraceae bacterium]
MNDARQGMAEMGAPNAHAQPNRHRAPHPLAWLVLYLPFGAVPSFVSVALGFEATQHGLSITQGALLTAAGMLISWLKWLWAPVVDITLTPRRWYLVAALACALGTIAMATIPLDRYWLGLLLVCIAATFFASSVLGMAVEAMITVLTPTEQIGRASSWLQSGNLGGGMLGGGLGLLLFTQFSAPEVSGVVVGVCMLACCLPLWWLPPVAAHSGGRHALAAVREVAGGLWGMLKSKLGFLSAFLCVLPIGTGAAQAVLAQAAVAHHWGAGAHVVEIVQGVLFSLVTVAGCFAGGWICDRLNPRGGYALFGLFLAIVDVAMAFAPATVGVYVGGTLLYAFGVGLAYAGFTAVVLTAVGDSPAATGYNVFASLSNFPIWWLGLLLGWLAERYGGPDMLLGEAVLGIVAVLLFALVTRVAGESLFARAAHAGLKSGAPVAVAD